MGISEEDREIAYKNGEIQRQRSNWACDMCNKTMSEYSRFLGILSGIILGLSPLLLSNKEMVLFVKIFFVVSLSFIILSLPFAAINLLIEYFFFKDKINIHATLFKKWDNVATEKLTFSDAKEFERGITENIRTDSPFWPIIVQSTMVSLGFFGLLVVIIAKIFQ